MNGVALMKSTVSDVTCLGRRMSCIQAEMRKTD